jgi:hypothetical protein
VVQERGQERVVARRVAVAVAVHRVPGVVARRSLAKVRFLPTVCQPGLSGRAASHRPVGAAAAG